MTPGSGGTRWSRDRLAWAAAALLAALAAGAAAVALAAERRLSAMVLGGLGESFSTTVYASPYVLHDGSSVRPEGLLARLERLKYRKVEGKPGAAGEYAWREPVLSVHLRGFRLPERVQEAKQVRLTSAGQGRWRLEDLWGEALRSVALEPEPVAELSGAQKVRRSPAEWEEFPQELVMAVVAAEDRRFFRHWGLDPRAILRAAWHNLRGGPLHGGSTLTQQLAKNLFLTPARTFRRKAAEALFALYLEARYSKEEILTLYLNHIYMGQDGPVSVAGMPAAAGHYFGKTLPQLSLAESALLAGLIRSPYLYNPFRRPEEARARRDYVLRRLRQEGVLDEAGLERALAEPVRTLEAPSSFADDTDAAYFVAEVVRGLAPRLGEESLFRHGLKIHTTMDPVMQEAAQAAVRRSRRQAALAAMDPFTGRVLALAGGRDFKESQFNRATQARRQAGSAFKPLVVAAALEQGFTAASLLADAPTSYPTADGLLWEPRNYDGVYRGTVTVREALSGSINLATLDLAERTGLRRIDALASELGVESPLEPHLGTALGASEVGLLELTAAYAAFANGGWRVRPHLVTAVLDAEGGAQEFHQDERKKVLRPETAYIVTSILMDAVTQGTGRSLVERGWTRPAAGKTGTSSQGKDAWFIGYTPELLAGVWTGEDLPKAALASGAGSALPVWEAFMTAALADYPESEFPEPEGLVEREVDIRTGALARSGCPEKRRELFRAGTEPTAKCPVHVGGVRGFFQRLFGGD